MDITSPCPNVCHFYILFLFIEVIYFFESCGLHMFFLYIENREKEEKKENNSLRSAYSRQIPSNIPQIGSFFTLKFSEIETDFSVYIQLAE